MQAAHNWFSIFKMQLERLLTQEGSLGFLHIIQLLVVLSCDFFSSPPPIPSLGMKSLFSPSPFLILNLMCFVIIVQIYLGMRCKPSTRLLKRRMYLTDIICTLHTYTHKLRGTKVQKPPREASEASKQNRLYKKGWCAPDGWKHSLNLKDDDVPFHWIIFK